MTTESQATNNNAGSFSGVGSELMQNAARLKDSVGARAKQEAESRMGDAVQVAGSASAALNSAAENLERNPNAPDWMASALQGVARQIDRLAGHVDGRNIDDLGREIAQFARSHPGAFLAASAAAGFAAARVLRAGADKQRHDKADASGDQPVAAGQGYGVSTPTSGVTARPVGGDGTGQGGAS
jgi:hypothetical protein